MLNAMLNILLLFLSDLLKKYNSHFLVHSNWEDLRFEHSILISQTSCIYKCMKKKLALLLKRKYIQDWTLRLYNKKHSCTFSKAEHCLSMDFKSWTMDFCSFGYFSISPNNYFWLSSISHKKTKSKQIRSSGIFPKRS